MQGSNANDLAVASETGAVGKDDTQIASKRLVQQIRARYQVLKSTNADLAKSDATALLASNIERRRAHPCRSRKSRIAT
jgi:hypothetical protein